MCGAALSSAFIDDCPDIKTTRVNINPPMYPVDATSLGWISAQRRHVDIDIRAAINVETKTTRTDVGPISIRRLDLEGRYCEKDIKSERGKEIYVLRRKT